MPPNEHIKVKKLRAQCRDMVAALHKILAAAEWAQRNVPLLLDRLETFSMISNPSPLRKNVRLVLLGENEGNLFRVMIDGKKVLIRPSEYDIFVLLAFAQKYRKVPRVPVAVFHANSKNLSVYVCRLRKESKLTIKCNRDGYELCLRPEELEFQWVGQEYTKEGDRGTTWSREGCCPC
ncbi:MAG: hypothetical protein V1798_11100 [Pseudomonadota bacterium]